MKLTKKEKTSLWIGLYNLLSNLEKVDGMSKDMEKTLFKLMDKFNLAKENKSTLIDTACFIVDKTEYMCEIEKNILIAEIIGSEKVKITIDYL